MRLAPEEWARFEAVAKHYELPVASMLRRLVKEQHDTLLQAEANASKHAASVESIPTLCAPSVLRARMVATANEIADPVVVIADDAETGASVVKQGGSVVAGSGLSAWRTLVVDRSNWAKFVEKLYDDSTANQILKKRRGAQTVVVHAQKFGWPHVFQVSNDDLRAAIDTDE